MSADTKNEAMNDLLYIGESTQQVSRVKQDIIRRFPDLRVSDTWDDVHQYRIPVDGITDRKAWFEFLVDEGLATVSICWLMNALDNAEAQ